MARGQSREWTLDELQLIWTFNGSDGQTVTAAAEQLGIVYSTWYSMRARLQVAGGPEALFAQMQAAKENRYSPASRGVTRTHHKRSDTPEDSLKRTYFVRIANAGRGGTQPQYTVTIPVALAKPFVERHGREILFEPREDGILIKPVPPVVIPDLPSWLRGDGK